MRSHLLLLLVGLACASKSKSTQSTAPTTAPSTAAPAPVEPTPAPSAQPTELLDDHGVAITVPAGWSTKRGPGWVMLRAPDDSAGVLLYGVKDIGAESAAMLHLAEDEFHVTMPLPSGPVTQFGGGLRMVTASGPATREDGTPVAALSLAGGSPRMHPKGAVGAFAFWRQDSTPAQLQIVQEAVNSMTAVPQ